MSASDGSPTLRRVAVTGIGVVSALGRSVDEFWAALLAPRGAFRTVERFDAADDRTHVGAEIPGGDGDAAAYALAAARAALADAGLASREDVGLALGTTLGEEWRLEGAFARFLDENLPEAQALARVGELSPANVPARVAGALGLRGPNVMLTTACAAGNTALAYAYDRVAVGACEAMLAGGVDVFSRVIFSGFNRLLAVAPEVCAPFSKGRKGLIPGEGCAVLAVETLEAARARGARVYAELLGYGASCDAAHVTTPDLAGVARSISDCLARSGLGLADVDYVNAHGTGTPANDKTETAALKAVLGPRAAAVPVSSIKSVLGHAMGAASAFEAAACCLALTTGRLPPTANFSPGDPDCDLDYVGEGARRKDDLEVALSNAFAFGGGNCVVAFGRPGRERPAAPLRFEPIVVTAAVRVEPAPIDSLLGALPSGKDLSFVDAPAAYALSGVHKALGAAGLPDPAGDDVGLVLDSAGEWGSLFAFYKDLHAGGPRAVEPRQFPNLLGNAAASRAAIAFGLRRLSLSLAGSFPGGELAVAAAYRFLRARGPATLLAGAVDAGAELFVVETAGRARARGARPLAELVDAAESFDRPGPSGVPLSQALARARAGSPAACEAVGRWGGRVRLALRPWTG